MSFQGRAFPRRPRVSRALPRKILCQHLAAGLGLQSRVAAPEQSHTEERLPLGADHRHGTLDAVPEGPTLVVVDWPLLTAARAPQALPE